MWTEQERQATLQHLFNDGKLSAEKTAYIVKLQEEILALTTRAHAPITAKDILACRLGQLQRLFNLPSHDVSDFVETSIETLVETYGIYWAASEFAGLDLAVANVAFIAKGACLLAGISFAVLMHSLSRNELEIRKVRNLLTVIEYNRLRSRKEQFNRTVLFSSQRKQSNSKPEEHAKIKSVEQHADSLEASNDADAQSSLTETSATERSKLIEAKVENGKTEKKKSSFIKFIISKKVWKPFLTGLEVAIGICEIYWAITTINVVSVMLASSALLGIIIPIYGLLFALAIGGFAAWYRHHTMKKAELLQKQLKSMQQNSVAIDLESTSTFQRLHALHAKDLLLKNSRATNHDNQTSATATPMLSKNDNKYSITRKPGQLIINTTMLSCIFFLFYWLLSDVKFTLLLLTPALASSVGICILFAFAISYVIHRNMLKDEAGINKRFTQVQLINQHRKEWLQQLTHDYPEHLIQSAHPDFIVIKKPLARFILGAIYNGSVAALTLFGTYWAIVSIFSSLALLPVTSLLAALVLTGVICAAIVVGIVMGVAYYKSKVKAHQQQNELMSLEHENSVLLNKIEDQLQAIISTTNADVVEEQIDKGTAPAAASEAALVPPAISDDFAPVLYSESNQLTSRSG